MCKTTLKISNKKNAINVLFVKSSSLLITLLRILSETSVTALTVSYCIIVSVRLFKANFSRSKTLISLSSLLIK